MLASLSHDVIGYPRERYCYAGSAAALIKWWIVWIPKRLSQSAISLDLITYQGGCFTNTTICFIFSSIVSKCPETAWWAVEDRVGEHEPHGGNARCSDADDIPAVDRSNHSTNCFLNWIVVTIASLTCRLHLRRDRSSGCRGGERGVAGDQTVVGGEVYCWWMGFSGCSCSPALIEITVLFTLELACIICSNVL